MLTRKKNLAILIAAIIVNAPVYSNPLHLIAPSDDGVNKYDLNIIEGITQIIEGDNVMYNTVINAGGGQRIINGGESNNITINEGGYIFVNTGGVANDVIIYGSTWEQYASATVSNGGTLNNATLSEAGAELNVGEGGVANHTVVKDGVIWQRGGTLNNTVVESPDLYSLEYGRSYQITGGESNNTILNNGFVYVLGSEAVVNDAIVNDGVLQVANGIANNTVVNGGKLVVDIDGSISNSLIHEGGTQIVRIGGKAFDTVINNGLQTIQSRNSNGDRALAVNTTVNGGVQEVLNDGTAQLTTLNENGIQYIVSDSRGAGLAQETVINDKGIQIVGQSSYDRIIDKAKAQDTTINRGGTQYVYDNGITEDTTINGGRSVLFTGASAMGTTTINESGEMLMEAGALATDVKINGGVLSVTDLTDETTSTVAAQIDKLTMDGGSVSFLRDSDGDFAALNISHLSGSGNFLFNSSLAERNSNFVTIEQGTGQFGIAVTDSGKEIADHNDLTVNLVHDQGGDIDFSMVTANGRSTGAIDGGTYMYSLYSQQNKDGLNGNVWYLGAMRDDEENGGNEGGGNEGGGNEGGGNEGGGNEGGGNEGGGNEGGGNEGGGNEGGGNENEGNENGGNGNSSGKLKTTPATDAVLSMASAGINIVRSELDALRTYRTNQSHDRVHGEGNVWGHYLGKKSAVDTSNGAAYKLHQNGFELGGDMTSAFDSGKLVTGGFVTLSDNNVSHARGGKSRIDSYGLGAYATWYDNSGFYVDGVIKGNRLESKLNARMTNGGATSGDWHQYGISTAIEAGYTLKPADNITVEPYLRSTATHINSANVKLSNGMKAETGKARSLTAEAGTKLGTAFSLGNTQFEPYLRAGIEQEFAKSNESVINGVNRFDNNVNGTSGKYGAGLSVQLTSSATLYGEVNYRQGSYVEEPVQGIAGIRIGF